ncbi:MAG: hypothetical protein AAGC85_13930, partial [Bacteroidota bacterium]
MLNPHPKVPDTLAGKEPTHIRKPKFSFRHKPGLWMGVIFLLCHFSLSGNPTEPVMPPCTGPTITVQPQDSTTTTVGGADFRVRATGVGSITYQWQLKTPQASTFSDIPSATFSTLSATITASANGNQYRAIITDDNNTPSDPTDDCQVTSNIATLGVTGIPCPGPTITLQPQDSTIILGETVAFSVEATGVGNLEYVWQRNGPREPRFFNVGSSGNPMLTLQPTADLNRFRYRVTIKDDNNTPSDPLDDCRVISNAATLRVTCPGPTITSQPSDQSDRVAGDLVQFSVGASGTGTLSYQWQLKTPQANSFSNIPSAIPSATSSSYSLIIDGRENGYQYRVIITDDNNTPSDLSDDCQGTSNVATITIFGFPCLGPFITLQPQDSTTRLGGGAAFRVSASGAGSLTYQWQVKTLQASTFSNIPSATSSSLEVTAAAGDNGNQYRAVIIDDNRTPSDPADDCQVTTNAATLGVTGIPCTGPTITVQPRDSTTLVGSGADFLVTASGVGNLSYQWQLKTLQDTEFSNIAVTTRFLVINNPELSANGNQYRVIVSDDNGTPNDTNDDCQVTSDVATLRVTGGVTPCTGPIIIFQPRDSTTLVGGGADFNVTATGVGTLSYQWQLKTLQDAEFSNIAVTTRFLVINNAELSANGNQYRVIVSDDNGTPNDTNDDCQVTSNVATLRVTGGVTPCTGPTIIFQPRDSTTLVGGGADFNVTASGVGTLSYQWQLKTPQDTEFSNIAVTTRFLVINNAELSANGNQYRVIVSDDNNTPNDFLDDCFVFSTAATLTVTGNPPDLIKITEFMLVDAETNTEIREIKDGDKLLLENVPPSFSIIAKVEGTRTTNRVFLDLNGPVNKERTERRVPYAVFGDNRGNYSGRPPRTGTYDITAVPFYRDGSLMEGRPLTVNFEIVDCASSGPRANAGPDLEVGSFCTGTIPPLTANITGGNGGVDFIWTLPDGTASTEQTFVPLQFGFFTLTATDELGCTSSDEVLVDPCPTNCDPAIVRLVLVNSATNEDIMTIRNADVVDLSRVGRELNVRADLQCGATVESVKWELTGTQVRTRVENKAPYALAGDNNGNYSNQNFRPGSYTIEASPFNMNNAQGIMGAAALLNFTVINGTPAAQTGFSD